MRQTAGTVGRGLAMVLLIALTACSVDDPQNLVAAGESTEAVDEPTTTITTSTSTTTTITTAPPVPETTPPAPPVPPVPPVTSPPPTVPNPPLEPGMEPNGYGGYGGTRTVTSGTTIVALSLYPRESYAGQMTQVGVEVRFVGGMRSIRIDYGDGTFYDGVYFPEWSCNGVPGAKTTSAGGGHHFYAQPGSYQVTATVTSFNCSPDGGSESPPSMFPTLPDGTMNPEFLAHPHVGVESVTVAAITAISRPDRVPVPPPLTPPANCPPQAGGC